LNNFERLLMQLTQHELNGHAEFLSDSSFRLKSCPFPGDIPLGLYELPRRSGEAHLYRLNHPLAEHLLAQAKNRALPPAEVVFDLSQHEGKISILEPFVAQSGYLTLALFTVEALDHAEDYLLITGMTDSGRLLKVDAARRAATAALTLEEKLAGQKQIKAPQAQPEAGPRRLVPIWGGAAPAVFSPKLSPSHTLHLPTKAASNARRRGRSRPTTKLILP
jgi:hypothetical protein